MNDRVGNGNSFLGPVPTTNFIISVDVESRSKGDPTSDIWGRLPNMGGEYGIGKIMDMLEAHCLKGTFFLNVYEMAQYGERALRTVAQSIHQRGHDLQLHTHPRTMFGFYGMANAPLQDQIQILGAGRELLRRWTGTFPKVHRAGAFHANAETLRASELVGLKGDSSLSAGSRNPSQLVAAFGPTNWVRRIGNLWIIPVTHYFQVHLGFWRSRRILDIEGSSLAEIRKVVRWALRYQVPTVCILMHSFSLCRRGTPNLRVIRRLDNLLDWLDTQSRVRVTTIGDVCDHLSPIMISAEAPEAPEAPHTGLRLTWWRALSSWNEGWRNGLVAALGVCCITAVAIALIWLWQILVVHFGR